MGKHVVQETLLSNTAKQHVNTYGQKILSCIKLISTDVVKWLSDGFVL